MAATAVLVVRLAMVRATAADSSAALEAGYVPPAPPASAMPAMPYAQMAAVMGMDDTQRFAGLLVDQLEWRDGADGRSGAWDAEGWYGNDRDKLWISTEGEQSLATARGRVELSWDRVLSRWWNLQAGARYDLGPGPGKGWAALGVRGLAPYWIDVEATMYVGAAGNVAARLKAESDLLLTQRLILQPELELNAYAQADHALEQAAGLPSLQSGLRLRYEIRREFAPYLGVAWVRRVGAGAPPPRTAQDWPDGWQWLAGVRLWF
jgi:copper resistance protein B